MNEAIKSYLVRLDFDAENRVSAAARLGGVYGAMAYLQAVLRRQVVREIVRDLWTLLA